MRNAQHSTVLLEGITDDMGDAEVYSTPHTPLYGDVLSVLVDGIALSDGADLVLVEALTGASGIEVTGPDIVNNGDIGNAAPTELTPSTVLQEPNGTTRVSGTDDIPTLFALHGGRLKATVANGGDTKAFKIWVTIKN